MKWQVRVRGTTLVWLDNRSVWDADSTFDDIVEYDLYWHEISDTPGSGTKLNSSPWRSTRSQLAQQMVENNGSTAGFWDYARPEIGDGFVVISSLRKDMQQGLTSLPNHREVARIDLVGPGAGVERTLTHSSAAQSTPAADAMGNVVWQDRRDGAFWQIYWHTY
jgi:hypothetical protein